MAKIKVKLANPANTFKEGKDKIRYTGHTPFEVEDSQQVQDALKIRLLEKVVDPNNKQEPPKPNP